MISCSLSFLSIKPTQSSKLSFVFFSLSLYFAIFYELSWWWPHSRATSSVKKTHILTILYLFSLAQVSAKINRITLMMKRAFGQRLNQPLSSFSPSSSSSSSTTSLSVCCSPLIIHHHLLIVSIFSSLNLIKTLHQPTDRLTNNTCCGYSSNLTTG